MGVWDSQGGGNTHFSVVLTNISVAYPNDGMVGDQLFPQVPVAKQADKYYVFGREAWSVDPSGDLRAPGTVANEIPGLSVSTQTYFCQEHSLQIPVTDEERQNVDNPLSPDRDGTELVTSKLLLQREISMHTKVTTTGNFSSGYTQTNSGTSQWSDYTNSDPIGDFKTGRLKIHAGLFVDPTVTIIPYQVMSVLEDHPDFIERIKYSERGILTQEIIGAVIQQQNIVVPGLGYNSANPGQTASLGYLWGKDVLMAYVPARPGLKIPAFAYEFVQPTVSAPMATQTTQPVESWREEPRKSDIIRVSRRYDLRIVAQDGSGLAVAGYLIHNAVA
jgi:hypothetical protein